MGYESIVTCWAGKERSSWNGGGRHGVYEYPPVVANGHPTEKPEPLMAELVTLFTDPGETILDPFMGSGTTLVAAKRLGRKAIGIEIEEKYCEIAAKRLAQRALDFSDPGEGRGSDPSVPGSL
jgi:site-specific DNA-methyltransferase (adenine-specific)